MRVFIASIVLLAAAPAGAQDPAPAPAADPPVPALPALPAPDPPAAEAPVPADARVRHLPAHGVDLAEPTLQLSVDDPQAVGEIHVHYRTRGSRRSPAIAVASMETGGWTARLDPELLDPERGLEYWIVEVAADGTERPVFASASAPHPCAVTETAAARHEREELAIRGGRRSRAIVRGEYVGLGTRSTPASDRTEQYWRVEAGYAHAFYTRVEEVRLAIGRVRGNVVRLEAPSDPTLPDSERDERGLDYGTAEITWWLHDLVRARTSILFGYSQEGFAMGGGGELILGRPESTSFSAGVSGVNTVGWTVFVRLGWLTIPRVPMGATIEITTFPADAETGMRLLYDVGWALYPGALLKLQAGYRGWNSTTGGPSLGTEIALAF